MVKIEKSRNAILAKAEIVERLPLEKKLYSSPVEYAHNECWGFDDTRADDVEYMTDKIRSMNEYNDKATAFNSVLQSIYEFLS